MEEQDRRHYHRVSFQQDARLSWGEYSETVRVENLSLKGVLLSGVPTLEGLDAGERARLTIDLADDFSVAMTIELVFLRGDQLGARWVEIDLDGMTHLRRLVALNLGDANVVDQELSSILSD